VSYYDIRVAASGRRHRCAAAMRETRMLTYVLAVLAACANAASSVLQRKANRRAPRRET